MTESQDNSKNATEVDPLIGQLVTGRYRVHCRIGEGGMGTVYEAVHEAIEKKVALKVLHREYSQNPDVVERFKQEAISASRIKHPNVIDVFDFGQLDDGSCFIAMEFLEGHDLGDALAKVGAFDPEQAIRITQQICKALSLAHSRGVIHRDMKPENVFLQTTPEGDTVVKIVDFGIAQLRRPDDQEGAEKRRRRLTKTGMIFGTPEYMAPEQARGQNVDQRADIYASGVILYELLSGSVPFVGESFLEILNKHVLEPVPPLREQNAEVRISDELNRVVSTTLEKAPDQRFSSMKEFSDALLRTPEGRALRSSISSMSIVDGNELPPASQGPVVEGEAKSTAILGSVAPPGPASASTGESEPPVLPTKSSRGLLLLLALAVLGAGVAAFFLLGHGGEESTPVAVSDTQETASVSKSTDEMAGAVKDGAEESVEEVAGTETPLETADEEKASVVLHITTVPDGAVLLKGDFQVCDSTPCDVVAQPGEGMTLTARKAGATGQAKVLAQREQNVKIVLRSPKRPSRPSAPQPSPKKEKLCEVNVDGLKILRPCE